MRNRGLFLAGVAAGMIGGLLIRRLRRNSGLMSYLAAGRQALAETRGPAQAALLVAQARVRYEDLYVQRRRFDHPALHRHYEGGILPALALYQTLRGAGADQAEALAEVDRIVAARVARSGARRLVQLLSHSPDPFAVLRFLNRWVLKVGYPPEGWRFEWVEDSDACTAFDARECFYLNMLTAHGAPELTAHLCAADDLLYGDISGIAWERTKTLGRGDDRCNFRFCRAGATGTPRDSVTDSLCEAGFEDLEPYGHGGVTIFRARKAK